MHIPNLLGYVPAAMSLLSHSVEPPTCDTAPDPGALRWRVSAGEAVCELAGYMNSFGFTYQSGQRCINLDRPVGEPSMHALNYILADGSCKVTVYESL